MSVNLPAIAAGAIAAVGVAATFAANVPWRKRLLDELTIYEHLPDGPARRGLLQLINSDARRYVERRERRPLRRVLTVAWPIAGALWVDVLAFTGLGQSGTLEVLFWVSAPIIVAPLLWLVGKDIRKLRDTRESRKTARP